MKGVIELEGRADREGELPDPHRVAVRQLDDGQIGRLHFHHRDIGFFIRADDFADELAAIFQFHLHFLRAFDDVEVGEDETIRPNDEAGAFALHRLRRGRP